MRGTAVAALLLLLLAVEYVVSDDDCGSVVTRQDCGYLGINQSQCEGKGCCWSPKDNNPWCFFKNTPQESYIIKEIKKTALGVKITASINSLGQVTGPYGNLISPIVIEISAQTAERLHVKIYDPNNKRWEVPKNFSSIPDDPSSAPSSTLYNISYAKEGDAFSFSVTRISTKEVLFDASGLQFADQFLSLSTSLPDNYNLYGLGEHVTPFFRLQPHTYTMWTFDTATPQYLNIYGSHPFYLDHRPTGTSHGVFLRNSNGMDVILDDKTLTYNVIGGILDFYIFLGPEPEAVVQQYQEVIGRPHMPPYWALGFHQCRYGYPNVEALEQVVANYKSHSIPLDTMWTDIDYMDEYKDFTLDPNNFPKDKMNSFVGSLHQNGQHYVVIIDPGIKVDSTYKPYNDGKSMDIFIKDKNGKIFTGKVWPGITAFPDFFHPKADQYWQTQISDFLNLLPVDGLWIDMNEISNFCTGECTQISDQDEPYHLHANQTYLSSFRSKLPPAQQKPSGKVEFDPNSPPYRIHNQGSNTPLNVKTLDMDCQHHGGVLEYNAHNLFGLSEAIATNMALENLKKKRSLVISRSTFPGSGKHAGHWTGDNHASFEDLYLSIPDVLNFQMYGIPLIGADICGFIGNTNEELCSRWMELGAFYPFSRNHNNKGSMSQEPYQWDSVAAISRKVLGIRYSLLPYYYTLFYKAHREPTANASATVWRPLFFEFPKDSATFVIDRQFMVGSSLLISPALDQGATSVKVYFPKTNRWYDFYTQKIISEVGGESKTLDTPIDHIQVHICGGSIIPMQLPALTTTEARKNNFTLLVALDSSGRAEGDFYIDDGESLDMRDYTFVEYSCSGRTLNAKASGPGYSGATPPLDTVTILGLSSKPSKVTLNGQTIDSHYDSDAQILKVSGMGISMSKDFVLSWA